MNVNEDPLLTGQLRHVIDEGYNDIGKDGTIKIGGLGIAKEHSMIEFSPDDNTLIINPNDEDPQKFKTNVNGQLITSTETLKHGDHILLGNSNLYVVVFPQQEITL
jgi:hypothetical protein